VDTLEESCWQTPTSSSAGSNGSSSTGRSFFDHGAHGFQLRSRKKLLSLVPEDRLRRILKRLFDENEFLSPHGIRSLSKAYADQPYCFDEGTEHASVGYSPGDSPVAMFGGNSNWRGPSGCP